MPVYPLILFCLFSVLFQPAWALTSADILPAEQAFKLTVTGQSRQQVDLVWQIAEGYHLYRDKTRIESQTDGVQLGAFELPDGAVEHDPVFGETSVYRGSLRVSGVDQSNNQATGRFSQISGLCQCRCLLPAAEDCAR